MKKIILLASLLAAGASVAVSAREFVASAMPPDLTLTLEEIAERTRVTVGQSRAALLEEMRQPNVVLLPDVWVYTGFRATTVHGAELYDTLIVTFKDDKVAAIKLVTEEQVRVAASRLGVTPTKVVRR